MASILDSLDEIIPLRNVVELPKPSVVTAHIPHWDKHRAAIAELSDGLIYSIEEIEEMIRTGRALFFPSDTSAVVTEVTIRGNRKCMECIAAVGEMIDVTAMVPGIEALARAMGCEMIILEGRKGWEKVMKPCGYEFMAVSLKKVL